MLVQVKDPKGKLYWINPLYVRLLKEKGKDRTEVTGVNSSWGTPMVVDEPMDSLAERISVAMPNFDAAAAVIAMDDEQQQQAAGATVAAG
ncbi:MAG: hypothetical protein EA380_01375 [Phycisphaeraceae bacterium]|nr:MAG: hypothetical protein EA380_01375 [Phycisphaeraceae bacterium]